MSSIQELSNLDCANERLLKIKRPAYSIKTFEKEFATQYIPKKKPLLKKLKAYAFKNFNPMILFSIVNLFTNYNFKEYLVPDILSGITGKIF